MVLSSTVYDNFRVRNLHIVGIDNGVLTTQNGAVIPIALQNDQILVGTTPKHIVGIDPVHVDITPTDVIISLTTGGISTLSYVPNDIPVVDRPYYTCMIESTGTIVGYINMEDGYSYRVYLECISENVLSFVRITTEWLVRYNGSITVQNIFDTKYTMGVPQGQNITVIPETSRILIQSSTNVIWSCKISVMRVHL
jgi:hypothetical protein